MEKLVSLHYAKPNIVYVLRCIATYTSKQGGTSSVVYDNSLPIHATRKDMLLSDLKAMAIETTLKESTKTVPSNMYILTKFKVIYFAPRDLLP